MISFGRQSGKSTWGNNECIKRAWEKWKSKYWFVLPTFDQAKTQFLRAKEMLLSVPGALLKRPNESELRITLANHSVVRYVSGESADNLKGETLDGAVIDENGTQKKTLWTQIIRPMLTTTKGWCAFTGTPKGFNHHYDLAERAKVDKNYAFFHSPSTCNPLFGEEELTEARKDMSPAEFAQEIMAEFRELHDGSAYVCYGPHNERRDSPFTSDGSLFNSYLPIVVGLDFNVTPMSWMIGQKSLDSFYYFDEIYLKKSHTQETCKELIARVKAMNLKAIPNLILVGDATGKSKTANSSGNTNYSIIHEMLDAAGITYEDQTPDSNPLVNDRINIMNAHLMSATGEIKHWFHPENCPEYRKDMQRVAWKAGAKFTLDKTSDADRTHASDAGGYPICQLSKRWEPSVGGLGIIRRT